MTVSRAVRLWAGCGVLSVLLLLLVGALGPSAAVVPLAPGPQGLAPAWPVTLLMWTSASAGGAALLLGLAALRRGWQPDARALLAAGLAGAAALLVVPPLGNGDVGSYAAYGRTVVLGESPYTTVPSALDGDAVVAAAEPPWQDQASVYGPVATASQYVAAALGGGSREAVLRLLALTAALGFAGVAAGLHRWAPDRGRAHVLWTCNPLLLLHLVAGAHVDVLLCLPLLLALTGRGRALRTGLALAAACAVKLTGGLSVAALVAARRGAALRGVAVAAVTGAALYLAAGGVEALRPVLEVRSRVSGGTPWRWVASGLETFLPDGPARTLVGLGVVAVAVVLARALLRDLPAAEPFLRASAVLWLAYLLAAGYQLAWYDAVGFLLLALLGASRWDGLLAVHCLALTVAYLPGRIVELPASLDALLPVLRSGLCPAVLLVLWVVAVRVRRPALAPEPV